jgi:hypothetical protein
MKNATDEIHFDCPKCKRPMRGDRALLGEMINCPDCNEPFFPVPRKPEPAKRERGTHSSSKSPSRLAMYMIFGLIAIILVIALVKKAEGPKEKTWREFSNEAEPMMLAEASNHIVGFRRMLHAYVDGHGDYKNPNVWTGNVEAEYINPIGGVSVTNVPFKFNLYSSSDGNMELHCSYDFKKDLDEQMARDEAEFKAKMKAAENGQ